MEHPLGQVLAAAGTLGNAERRPAAEPEILEARHRAEQGQSVGAVGDGSVDDAPDAGRFEDRHARHRATEPGHQALEIVGKQFAVGIPRRQSARRPGTGEPFALVDADQPGLLLLAQIGRGVGVARHREFFAPFLELRHWPRNQVVVLDVVDGKVRSHHLRHLPRVAAGRVDHGLGNDAALLREDFPFAARSRVDACHPVVPHDPGAQVARSPGHRVAEPGRVGVAVVGGSRHRPARLRWRRTD